MAPSPSRMRTSSFSVRYQDVGRWCAQRFVFLQGVAALIRILLLVCCLRPPLTCISPPPPHLTLRKIRPGRSQGSQVSFTDVVGITVQSCDPCPPSRCAARKRWTDWARSFRRRNSSFPRPMSWTVTGDHRPGGRLHRDQCQPDAGGGLPTATQSIMTADGDLCGRSGTSYAAAATAPDSFERAQGRTFAQGSQVFHDGGWQ